LLEAKLYRFFLLVLFIRFLPALHSIFPYWVPRFIIQFYKKNKVRISIVSIPKEIVLGLSEISLFSIHFGHNTDKSSMVPNILCNWTRDCKCKCEHDNAKKIQLITWLNAASPLIQCRFILKNSKDVTFQRIFLDKR